MNSETLESMGPDDQAHFLGVLKDAPNLKRIGFIDTITDIDPNVLMLFANAAAQRGRRLLFNLETEPHVFASVMQMVFDGSLWHELCVPLCAIPFLHGSVGTWMAVGEVVAKVDEQYMVKVWQDPRIQLLSVFVNGYFPKVARVAAMNDVMIKRTVHVFFPARLSIVKIQNLGMLFAVYHKALVMFQRCQLFPSAQAHQQILTADRATMHTEYAGVVDILHAIYHRTLWRQAGDPDASPVVRAIVQIGAETILDGTGNLNNEQSIIANLKIFMQNIIFGDFTIPPDNLHVMLDLGYRSWGREWDSAADAIGRMQTHHITTQLHNPVMRNHMWIRWWEHNLHVLWPQPMAAAEVAARSQFLGMSSVWPFASVFDT